MRTLPLLALGLAAAALAPVTGSAQGARPAEANQCFFTNNWRGWRAIDDKSMYARVGLNQVYRIDFVGGCPGLKSPAARLITSSVTGQVCKPLDLDVKVSDLQGFSTPCIVERITPLTITEIAALPKNLTP
jgi:hypothetical protein